MLKKQQIRAIKDELNELVVNECDRFFVGFSVYDAGSLRDKIARTLEKRDLNGFDQIAREIIISKQLLEADYDLLSYFESNTGSLLNHSGYQKLHRLYQPEQLGFKDKLELVNVITRAGLASCLGSRLLHTEAESTHETVVEVIIEYVQFAVGKINSQIPQFRLLFEERERNYEIYPQISFVSHLLEQIEILLKSVEEVLIKNGAAQDPQRLQEWVIKASEELEALFEITHKLRAFSNTLDKRTFIIKQGEKVGVIDYLVKNMPAIADLYRERAHHKKDLIERCQTLFDMSYAITGLDWLLSNVSKDSIITVASLATQITSEIELFNLLMMCPTASLMEWLVSHLLLDASLISQNDSVKRSRTHSVEQSEEQELKEEDIQSREEAKDFSISYLEEKQFSSPVKEYLMRVDSKIHREGLFERIVHLWILDYMLDFSYSDKEIPSWVLQRISEAVTQVELIKQRDDKSEDLDEMLLLTLSTFDLVGAASYIPACFHSRLSACFIQLPQLFQHLVIKQEATEGFISQGMDLCSRIESFKLRIVCYLHLIRYGVHNRHFLELAGANQIHIINSKGYNLLPSLFQILRDYHVSKAAQYSMAKHLCHVGRSTEGLFFLVRIIQDMFENERLANILLNDLPFFVEAISCSGASPLLRQSYQYLQTLEIPQNLKEEVEILLSTIDHELQQNESQVELDELNFDFKDQIGFYTDSQGLLEDVARSSIPSPTLSTIGRKKLFERKEIRDRQMNASLRVRKITTGQWDQEISGQQLSFAPPIDSMDISKEDQEQRLKAELEDVLEDENMIKEVAEDEDEGIGETLCQLMGDDDDN